MPAYVVADFTIDDEQAYLRYAKAFGTCSRRTTAIWPLTTTSPSLRARHRKVGTVILRFPDMETATAWWKSPEYQEIAEHRRAGTTPYLITSCGGVDRRLTAWPADRCWPAVRAVSTVSHGGSRPDSAFGSTERRWPIRVVEGEGTE